MWRGELDIDGTVGAHGAVRLGLPVDSELPVVYHARGGWKHPWSSSNTELDRKECNASD